MFTKGMILQRRHYKQKSPQGTSKRGNIGGFVYDSLSLLNPINFVDSGLYLIINLYHYEKSNTII